MEFFKQLLSPGFMPHGYCYLWDPRIVWLHVISDGLIAFSYYCVPVALVYFVRQRRDLPFTWIFWLFGAFILSCGSTHLLEVWNVWHSSYLLSGLIKAITAGVSVVTAAMLIPLVPKAISLPSPAHLQALNLELQGQIAERTRAEAALQQSLARSEQAFKELADQKSVAAERKRIADAVRESQEQLHGIIESAMDAIITVDEQQRIVLFNAAAETMFGCSVQDALGSAIDRFIPQRFRAAHADHHRGFAAGGVSSRRIGKLGALEAVRADGEEFQMEASISQVEVGGKKLFTVIVRDITERKRAEEALHESQQQYRVLFDEMLVGFALFEPIYDETGKPCDFRYLEVNAAHETHCGLGRDRVIGKTIREILPTLEPVWIETYRKVAITGESIHFDSYAEPLGRWLNLTVFRTCKNQVGVTFSDITERKRAEEAVLWSKERLQLALDSAQAGIWEWDLQTNRNIWSRQLWALYGLDLDSREPSYDLWLATIHPDDREMVAHTVQKAATRGDELNLEYRTAERNGRIRWLLARGQPLRDAVGQPVRFTGIVLDITERKRAEQALAKQAAELARSNRELEQFAYVASHDLQEPLRMVASYTQLLSERYRGQLDQTADKYIGYAVEGALRMQTLVHDLLAFSRAGRDGLDFKDTDCNAVVEEAIQNLRSAIEESGAVITHGAIPVIVADRSRLLQVLQNLIGNAIKFRGKEPPAISVSVEKQGAEWQFAVTDNGIGIAPEHQEVIFAVFQRLHTRAEYAGNGIGLAICKKIIEHYGGKIWVESREGEGCSFKFTLPVETPKLAQGATA